MSFFKRLFRGTDRPAGGHAASMPWDERPSIFDHVRSHISADKPGLAESGFVLPDEERVNQGSKIRWAAGARDGVAIHHMGARTDSKDAERIVEVISDYCAEPTVTNKANLYRLLVDQNIVSIIDSILSRLLNRKITNQSRLYDLAKSLATESPDREPVKLALSILGLFPQSDNGELFQILGRHDEFTLFCAVALSNTSNDKDTALWTLARNVNGWGRIHVVERLANTECPEIKQWLLREGYRNTVMNEYLACICARAGGLLSALSEDNVDRQLLNAAGEMIEAMIVGGPAENIDDYEDGPLVIEMYLNQMSVNADTLVDFMHVHSIKRFFEQDESKWAARFERNWKEERRERMNALCDVILTGPHWPILVQETLNSRDDEAFNLADQAASQLGIDTWVFHWHRLQQKPTDPVRWYHVMAQCNKDRIDSVVAAAENRIDLSQIATGPGSELGLGPGYELHSCLDYVLQQLRHFPGHGHKLIQAGLKSPVIRNRNMALAVISEWGQTKWTNAIRDSLTAAIKVEPEEDLRKRMAKAIKEPSE